jgi:Tfp pilus assembly protein PilV
MLQAGLSLITLVAVVILAICNLAMWLLAGDTAQNRRPARLPKARTGSKSTRRRTSKKRRR